MENNMLTRIVHSTHQLSASFFSFQQLPLLILFLTADWARCRDGCEEDTEEEQQECDQEDQGVLLLQVGQPAGLAAIFNFIQPVGRDSSLIVLQDKDEALPTGWMKKRQFRSTLSEGVELMTGFDWYNVATIFCEKKMSQILVIIFLKILKSVKIIAILVD